MNLHLSWDEFNRAVLSLAEQVADEDFTGVYGQPRGGLPLAVALSHRLGQPLLARPTSRMLWVDDVVDGAATVGAMQRRFPDAVYAAWVRRRGSIAPRFVYHAKLVTGSSWIVFPWEVPEHATAEAAKYAATR